MAPFQISEKQPILLIRPDSVETVLVDSGFRESRGQVPDSHISQEYAIDFANFHSQLVSGTFRKIVLARCADETSPDDIPPLELFQRACMLYPRMFIALVSTEKSGCWLTATPEILLEGKAEAWRTIALAGTMKLEGEQLNGEGETVRWSTRTFRNSVSSLPISPSVSNSLRVISTKKGLVPSGLPIWCISEVTSHLCFPITSISAICCIRSILRLLSADCRNGRLLNSSPTTNIHPVATIAVLWACSTLLRRHISMCRCAA